MLDYSRVGNQLGHVSVLCVDQTGKKYIIGIKVLSKIFSSFINIQCFDSTILSILLEWPQEYDQPIDVILVAITEYALFPDDVDYLSHHVLLNSGTQLPHFKSIWIACINLDKFNLSINQLQSDMEKWYYFLKHPADDDLYDVNKVIGDNELLALAYRELKSSRWSTNQTEEYRSILILFNEMRDIYLSGLKKESREGKRRIKTARNLIKEFRPIKEIARVTDLSIETVLKLYEQLMNVKSPLPQ